MASVSGYATAVVDKAGAWLGFSNITGPPDTLFAENPNQNYEPIAGITYGFIIPSYAVIKTVTLTITHKRGSGAVVSGTPYSQAALTRGGEAAYGSWFETAAPDPSGDWVITGPPATFGLATIPPSDVDASFGIIYRRSINADEVPLKSRFVDALHLRIDYDAEFMPSGGVSLGGSATVLETYNPTGGVVIGGGARLDTHVFPVGGVVLGGSGDLCYWSPIQFTNCDAYSPDFRVRGAHTDRVEEWVRDNKTGMWYPLSKATSVQGEVSGEDLADEPLRFPEVLDEE